MNNRLDYLDATRAFALLLGILFHASFSFMPIFVGWAVMDVSTSDVASVFITLSHAFRMELFFLIAGYFCSLSLAKHGVREFVATRVRRLLIPFLVGWLLLRPMLVSGWIMGAQSMTGEADVASALAQGVMSLIAMPESVFVGTHLWFLYYLMMFIIALVIGESVVKRYYRQINRLPSFNRVIVGFSRPAWLLLLALCISFWACLSMSRWGVDTPDKSLIPVTSVSVLYGVFFAAGVYFERCHNQFARFSSLSPIKCLIGLTAATGVAIMSFYELRTGHVNYREIKLGFTLCYVAMMWSWVSIIVGLFKHIASKPNSLVRYLSDASYWLYLIHLPVVIWLQVAVAEWNMHWLIKLVTVCAMTMVVSLIMYDLLIRPTAIGKLLNGTRKPSEIRGWLSQDRVLN